MAKVTINESKLREMIAESVREALKESDMNEAWQDWIPGYGYARNAVQRIKNGQGMIGTAAQTHANWMGDIRGAGQALNYALNGDPNVNPNNQVNNNMRKLGGRVLDGKDKNTVMAFQKAHGLKVDGILGPRTKAAAEAEGYTITNQYIPRRTAVTQSAGGAAANQTQAQTAATTQPVNESYLTKIVAESVAKTLKKYLK